MKTARLLPVALLALLACSGTASNAPTLEEPAKTATTNAPVIAALKTHDGNVSILGGGKELRVVVKKDDGRIVADNATLDELRAKDPETWLLVKSAVAQGAGTQGTYLDATFDTRHAIDSSPASHSGPHLR